MTTARAFAVWLVAAAVSGFVPAGVAAPQPDIGSASYPWSQVPTSTETVPVLTADASYPWVQPPSWIPTAPVPAPNPATASYPWVQPPSWIPTTPAAPFEASTAYEWTQLR